MAKKSDHPGHSASLFAAGDPACHFVTAEVAAIGNITGIASALAINSRDIMVQTADGQGLQTELGVLNATAGTQHSYTQADMDRVTALVEARVKDMMATGASDAEIKAAVALLATNYPGLARVAQDVADKQLAADQFNLFSTRDAAGTEQSQSGHHFLNPFMALVGAVVVSEAVASTPNLIAGLPLVAGPRRRDDGIV